MAVWREFSIAVGCGDISEKQLSVNETCNDYGTPVIGDVCLI